MNDELEQRSAARIPFVIRISTLIRHSGFIIRHFN
jgi:hypothetical protein